VPRHGKKAHHEEEHENHERWLVSYADMITVLMAFFIMLYGMSILDLKKFSEFKAGVAKQLGKAPVETGGQGLLVAGTGIVEAAAPPIGSGSRDGATDSVEVRGEVSRANVDRLITEVAGRLQEAGVVAQDVSLSVDPRGLVVYLPDRVLFESGSAVLHLEGLPVLDQVADALAHIDNTFLVEGHTDDVPTRNPAFTNWELSTARATNVLRYLVERRGVPAVRAGAAGYADTRPRAPNDSDVNRATNRRVEIVVIISDEGGDRHGEEEEV
jgi:chemotaxis protein MotB